LAPRSFVRTEGFAGSTDLGASRRSQLQVTEIFGTQIRDTVERDHCLSTELAPPGKGFRRTRANP